MFARICKVSSFVVGSTITFWNLRSSAPSFSIDLRYSSTVVAPIHCMTPRANAGFMMLAASMLPGVDPAPMMVCISSMKTMMLGLLSSSLSRARMRSSNCPRYFVPATMAVMSRLTTRLLKSMGDVLWPAMSCARPSTIALFPTPGSPMSMGLFFFLRPKISTTRCISFSLPTTGSSLPSAAALVRSTEKLSITGVLPLPCGCVAVACCLALSLPCFDDGLSSSASSMSSSGRPIPSFVAGLLSSLRAVS